MMFTCINGGLAALLWHHINDSDLERYHLGVVTDEMELAQLEEHILGCPACAERAEECACYVDTNQGGHY